MSKYDYINSNLKIGSNCFYMNVSAFFELKKTLYLSLSYTNTDFIYNKDTFLKFTSDKPAYEYVSKDNDLIIAGEIDSVYMADVGEYLYDFSKLISEEELDFEYIDSDLDLECIKREYLSKEIPIFFTCDHYYMYEDYKKIINSFLHFHTPSHMAILLDVDFENNTALVLDKFYSFFGQVNLDNFSKAISSEYLTEAGLLTLKDSQLLKGDNSKDLFMDYLKKNISIVKQDEYLIGNNRYYKNIIALGKFKADFIEIATTLQCLKGKYAPQFLSKLLSATIMQQLSFKNLLVYYNTDGIFKEAIEICEEASKLWFRIDTYNDKTYLSGKSLLDNSHKYLDLLNNLLELYTKLFQKLDAIL